MNMLSKVVAVLHGKGLHGLVLLIVQVVVGSGLQGCVDNNDSGLKGDIRELETSNAKTCEQSFMHDTEPLRKSTFLSNVCNNNTVHTNHGRVPSTCRGVGSTTPP
eukprot:8385677-Ditylum_brightwellii.AAC.1